MSESTTPSKQQMVQGISIGLAVVIGTIFSSFLFDGVKDRWVHAALAAGVAVVLAFVFRAVGMRLFRSRA